MLPRKRYVTTVMQTCLEAVRRQHQNGCRHKLKEALLPVETSQNTKATLGRDLTMQKVVCSRDIYPLCRQQLLPNRRKEGSILLHTFKLLTKVIHNMNSVQS